MQVASDALLLCFQQLQVLAASSDIILCQQPTAAFRAGKL